MSVIQLPNNPVDGTIFNISATRKLVFSQGAWKLHTNNLILTEEASFLLNPLVSDEQPATSVPERLWFQPSTTTMYYKYSTVGGTIWVPIKDSDQAIELMDGNVDLTQGDLFILNMTMELNDVSVEVLNPKAYPGVSSFILEINNGASGIVSWMSGVNWEGGVPPVLTEGTDIIGFYSRDGGSSWRGFEMALDSKGAS